MNQQLAADLRAAKALIDTPEKWTRRAYAKTSQGVACLFSDEAAQCFCALGAIFRVTPSLDREVAAVDAIKRAMGVNYIPSFNDYHSHAEVMEAFDRAIAAAEAES